MSYHDYQSNSYRHSSESYDQDQVFASGFRSFMNRVYNWMGAGLVITGVISYFVYQTMLASHSEAVAALESGSTVPLLWRPGTALLLLILQFAIVIGLTAAINKINAALAGFCFLLYSALTGITLAPIFFQYSGSAISSAFFVSAGMFAGMSIFGYMTRADLSRFGSLCIMGLWGFVLATLVNLFWKNSGFDLLLNYLGVAIFLGLTAWDTQRLKMIATGVDEEEVRSDSMRKYAIVGALQLYLDFINLFLLLLRLFGRGRD